MGDEEYEAREERADGGALEGMDFEQWLCVSLDLSVATSEVVVIERHNDDIED